MALTREGVPPARATALAGQVKEEARLAWNFPPFSALRERAEIVAEWPLEDFDGRGRVRVGRLDLLLRLPSGRVILDFKTGRPGSNLSEWIQSQRQMHGAQLRAYAEMARRAEPTGEIRAALFFTAVPRLEWIGEGEEITREPIGVKER
jgi:ATP-dependent exoDNAse (exonuclease V) beta subunit